MDSTKKHKKINRLSFGTLREKIKKAVSENQVESKYFRHLLLQYCVEQKIKLLENFSNIELFDIVKYNEWSKNMAGIDN